MRYKDFCVVESNKKINSFTDRSAILQTIASSDQLSKDTFVEQKVNNIFVSKYKCLKSVFQQVESEDFSEMLDDFDDDFMEEMNTDFITSNARNKPIKTPVTTTSHWPASSQSKKNNSKPLQKIHQPVKSNVLNAGAIQDFDDMDFGDDMDFPAVSDNFDIPGESSNQITVNNRHRNVTNQNASLSSKKQRLSSSNRTNKNSMSTYMSEENIHTNNKTVTNKQVSDNIAHTSERPGSFLGNRLSSGDITTNISANLLSNRDTNMVPDRESVKIENSLENKPAVRIARTEGTSTNGQIDSGSKLIQLKKEQEEFIKSSPGPGKYRLGDSLYTQSLSSSACKTCNVVCNRQ